MNDAASAGQPFLAPFEKSGAAENMQKDLLFLEACARQKRPMLRFYGWLRPSATFGISQKKEDLAAFAPSGLDAAKRPTGGGIVIHEGDLTYAIAVPREHFLCGMRARESYRLIHAEIAASFAEFGVRARLHDAENAPQKAYVCFETPALYDVVTEDADKIAGAAQKRNALGMLVQGEVRTRLLKNPERETRFRQVLTEKLLALLARRD